MSALHCCWPRHPSPLAASSEFFILFEELDVLVMERPIVRVVALESRLRRCKALLRLKQLRAQLRVVDRDQNVASLDDAAGGEGDAIDAPVT
jgi:hypothetical protein